MSRVDRKRLDFNINGKSLIKSFGGIKSEELKYYVIPTVKEQDPDRVIIHVGSNNVNFFNVKNKTAEEVAEDILEVGEMCKSLGVEDVTISSVLIKKNLILGKFIRDLNIVLENMCTRRNFRFINNDNIFNNLVSDDYYYYLFISSWLKYIHTNSSFYKWKISNANSRQLKNNIKTR